MSHSATLFTIPGLWNRLATPVHGRIALLFFSLIGFQPGCSGSDLESAGDRTKQWAEEIALGTEFGGKSAVVTRWTRPVRVSVMSGTATTDLDELLSLLNSLLMSTETLVQRAPDSDPSAELEVYITPLATFDQIARAHEFRNVPGNHGLFYIFWNEEYSLRKAYVLLASDKLTERSMRHFMLEEVTQSFGLMNDSSIYRDSIFYANGRDGGETQALSRRDMQLVKFLYKHMNPGDDSVAFDAAYDQYWSTVSW
jgi:hypothetical protein